MIEFAVVAAFAVGAWIHFRAVSEMARIIREKRPNGWEKGLFRSWPGVTNPNELFWGPWIINLLFGLKRLDLPDENYWKFLRAGRWSLLACMFLFAVFVFSLGWFTQKPT